MKDTVFISIISVIMILLLIVFIVLCVVAIKRNLCKADGLQPGSVVNFGGSDIYHYLLVKDLETEELSLHVYREKKRIQSEGIRNLMRMADDKKIKIMTDRRVSRLLIDINED